MGQAELLIAGLLVAVAGLSVLARRLSVPYPIVLVIGGALFGFIPGLPEVKLDPEVVLVVFLPPLLYGASVFANFSDFRANLRPLTLSTVGAGARDDVRGRLGRARAHPRPAVGGRVRPRGDRLADRPARGGGDHAPPRRPAAHGQHHRGRGPVQRRDRAGGLPRRGRRRRGRQLLARRRRPETSCSGPPGAWPWAWPWGSIVAEIRKRITDAQVSVTISLLTGYAAFVPANAIGASGILATVTAGIYMGIRAPQVLPSRARLEGYFVWDILDFIINAILFVLIGLQLRAVVDGLSGYSAMTLGGYALAVTAGGRGHPARVVLHRPVPDPGDRPAPGAAGAADGGARGGSWGPGAGCGAPSRSPWRSRCRSPPTPAAPFPKRNLIIFLTFAVIFFTLVVQGLSLPALIRRLGLSDGGADAEEETRARLVATKAALARDRRAGRRGLDARRDGAADAQHVRVPQAPPRGPGRQDRGRRVRGPVARLPADGAARAAAQREALMRMRSDGKLSNEVMNRIMHELDLEESRLEI